MNKRLIQERCKMIDEMFDSLIEFDKQTINYLKDFGAKIRAMPPDKGSIETFHYGHIDESINNENFLSGYEAVVGDLSNKNDSLQLAHGEMDRDFLNAAQLTTEEVLYCIKKISNSIEDYCEENNKKIQAKLFKDKSKTGTFVTEFTSYYQYKKYYFNNPGLAISVQLVDDK